MLPSFLLTLTLIFLHPAQDIHVATWSTGKPDSDAYESFSFWIKDNHRAYIRYSHGKDAESIDLSWLGTDSLSGMHGFRISPPNPGEAPLFLLLQGSSLHVLDLKTHAGRSFHWENENDTSGDSPPCTICAQSEEQAIDWLRRYFL
jgi:hypothetical protein